MPQSFGSLHCHIVFSTKHRRPQIKAERHARLFAYLGGILRNESCCLLAAGGMPDHVHLLVSLARTVAVADAVRVVKANSSTWAKDQLALDNFQWQTATGHSP
jgi:REP element-mobilizing transposase RayT